MESMDELDWNMGVLILLNQGKRRTVHAQLASRNPAHYHFSHNADTAFSFSAPHPSLSRKRKQKEIKILNKTYPAYCK
jgi:hypothetical protein